MQLSTYELTSPKPIFNGLSSEKLMTHLQA